MRELIQNIQGIIQDSVNEFGPMDLTTPEVAIKELYEWYKHHSKLKFDDKLFDTWIKN